MTLDKEEKVKDVFIGHKTRFVISQTGKVYAQGESKSFNLPNDQSMSSFKEFKLPESSTEEIIRIQNLNLFIPAQMTHPIVLFLRSMVHMVF